MVIIEQDNNNVIVRINKKIVGEIESRKLDFIITISNIDEELRWNKDSLYSLEVDEVEICQFSHFRKYNNLDQCLIDAAKAVASLDGNYQEVISILNESSEAVVRQHQQTILELLMLAQGEDPKVFNAIKGWNSEPKRKKS